MLTLAGDWKMPVNLHVSDPAGRSYPGRVETPLQDFSRLAGQFPRTTLILAHWGGLLPVRDPGVRGLRNLYYDTAASPLLYDATIWQRFSEAVAADQVLFGSDFPLNLFPRLQPEPDMARLLAEARQAGATDGVLGGNAARLLRF
ncbi:MAG: hypothetical protein EBR23_15200 [Planctomycetia bacterium]|nr:hypothetical protein [Planctomycetia bacterium]